MLGIGFILIPEKEMKFFMILLSLIHLNKNNNLINNTKLYFKFRVQLFT